MISTIPDDTVFSFFRMKAMSFSILVVSDYHEDYQVNMKSLSFQRTEDNFWDLGIGKETYTKNKIHKTKKLIN
jgi:hypothetical protein